MMRSFATSFLILILVLQATGKNLGKKERTENESIVSPSIKANIDTSEGAFSKPVSAKRGLGKITRSKNRKPRDISEIHLLKKPLNENKRDEKIKNSRNSKQSDKDTNEKVKSSGKRKKKKSEKMKKKKKLRRIKKTKEPPGTTQKRKDQKQCEVSENCVEAAISHLEMLRGRAKYFLNQLKRMNRQRNTAKKKKDKMEVFAEPINLMMVSMGNDRSSPVCGMSKSNTGAGLVSNITSVLSACRGQIDSACDLSKLDQPNSSMISECTANIKLYDNKLTECSKLQGLEACACWVDPSLAQLKEAIQPCSLASESKDVAQAMASCQISFGLCRKTEDKVGGHIFTCDQQESQVLAELKSLMATKRVLDATIKELETIINESEMKVSRQSSCSSVVKVAVSMVSTVSECASSSAALSMSLGPSQVSCSLDEINSLTSQLEKLRSLLSQIDLMIETKQGVLKDTRGNEALETEIEESKAMDIDLCSGEKIVQTTTNKPEATSSNGNNIASSSQTIGPVTSGLPLTLDKESSSVSDVQTIQSVKTSFSSIVPITTKPEATSSNGNSIASSSQTIGPVTSGLPSTLDKESSSFSDVQTIPSLQTSFSSITSDIPILELNTSAQTTDISTSPSISISEDDTPSGSGSIENSDHDDTESEEENYTEEYECTYYDYNEIDIEDYDFEYDYYDLEEYECEYFIYGNDSLIDPDVYEDNTDEYEEFDYDYECNYFIYGNDSLIDVDVNEDYSDESEELDYDYECDYLVNGNDTFIDVDVNEDYSDEFDEPDYDYECDYFVYGNYGIIDVDTYDDNYNEYEELNYDYDCDYFVYGNDSLIEIDQDFDNDYDLLEYDCDDAYDCRSFHQEYENKDYSEYEYEDYEYPYDYCPEYEEEDGKEEF